MIGAMVVLDLRMNFMNIFVITMIIGIGVDYGIHVIHRYREEAAEPGGDPIAAVEETSRGVLATIVPAATCWPSSTSMCAFSGR